MRACVVAPRRALALGVATRLPLLPPLSARKLPLLPQGDSCVVTRLPALALVGLFLVGLARGLASGQVFRLLQDVQPHLELLRECCVEHPAALAPIRVISVVEHDPTVDRVVRRIYTFHGIGGYVIALLDQVEASVAGVAARATGAGGPALRGPPPP